MKLSYLKNIFHTVVWLFCAGWVPAFAQSAEPAAASSDSDFKLSIAGRIHLDAAAYGEDGVAMDNGFLFRRAQLGASVTVAKIGTLKLITILRKIRLNFLMFTYATMALKILELRLVNSRCLLVWRN